MIKKHYFIGGPLHGHTETFDADLREDKDILHVAHVGSKDAPLFKHEIWYCLKLFEIDNPTGEGQSVFEFYVAEGTTSKFAKWCAETIAWDDSSIVRVR
jgi:hypothetical protein